MTFINLDILHLNFRELNSQLEELDNKLKRLEIISNNDLYKIFLLTNQMDLPYIS
jgi:predicted HAD superfamily phosphohydrolase YqeG